MTASGERFDKHAMTAAHRSLPLGTRVRVTNQKNGKTVVVRINDRGPFVHNRIIDLSFAAAQALDIATEGTGIVDIQTVIPDTGDETIAANDHAPPDPVAGVVPDTDGSFEPPLETRRDASARKREEEMHEDDDLEAGEELGERERQGVAPPDLPREFDRADRGHQDTDAVPRAPLPRDQACDDPEHVERHDSVVPTR